MSESPRGPFGWLRRWLSRGSTAPAPAAGEWVVTTGQRAVRVLEQQVGAAVVEAELGGEASARAQLAAAAGRALTGQRVALFAPADALASSRDQLAALAARRVPLVVHATYGGPNPPGSGTGGSLGDALSAQAVGWPVAVASTAQEAVELSLVAHRLAEEALSPVLVAADGPVTMAGPVRLQLPSEETIRKLVGSPDDERPCSGDVERLLFGTTRRRLPRWLDLGAPSAVGAARFGLDRGLAELGRELFFDARLGELLAGATADVAAATGRSLEAVRGHRLDGARLLLVTRGALVEPARVVVDRLRGERQRVGVVSVGWERPFPLEALRSVITGAERVAVLEAAGGDESLVAAVSAALGRGGELTRVAAAAPGLPTDLGELAELARRLLQSKESPPARVVLGLGRPGQKSAFPRREVLVEAARRALPEAAAATGGASGDGFDPRPAGALTAAWWGAPDREANSALTRLARALAEAGRPAMRTRWQEVAEHGWSAHLTAAAADFDDPGDDLRVDVVVLAGEPGATWVNRLGHAVLGGAVVIARHSAAGARAEAQSGEAPTEEGGGDDAAETPTSRPLTFGASELEAIRERGLRVFAVAGGPSALADAAAWVLAGADGEAPEGVAAVDVAHLEAMPAALGSDDDVPFVVRRHRSLRERFDNLARFWGEVVQPRVLGEAPVAVPDPLVALGAVPANAASLHDRTPARAELPALTAAKCTGCGLCWTSCPDTALAPVALTTEAWLAAGLERAAGPGTARNPAVDKLRRSLPQLAKRLDGQLAKGGAEALEAGDVRDAFGWLVEKMAPGDEEREGMTQAIEGALEALGALDVALTEPLFRGPHAAQPGQGALLMLAVDPHACQGCGVCAAECPEDALAMVPQTDARLAATRAGWHLWEALPDSAGDVVERARKREDIGSLAAVLLSRYVTAAVAGADGAEPGSGERLAARQVLAVVEFERQRSLAQTAETLRDLGRDLRQAIRDQLGDALAVVDPVHVEAALHKVGGVRVRLAEVVAELESQGDRALVDPLVTDRLEASQAVLAREALLTEGPEGLGQARFAVVLDRVTAESWGARFPRNPFSAPVAVALDGDTASLAIGVAEGLAVSWLDVVRAKRWAETALKAPSTAKVKAELAALAELDWNGLTREERLACPKVVVLAAAESLLTDDLAGLSRLMRSPWPILVVVTDGRGVPDAVDPVLLALAHREAFVMSTSVAHPNHLIEGVSLALREERAALVHVYAPSPGRHGFVPSATVERARLAVASRVHPLVRYDPDGEGVFGTRLALAGNESPGAAWVVDEAGEPLKPSRWAAGERRFEEVGPGFDEAWGHRWRLLQELAGVVTPFTERVRAAVTEELETAKGREIEALVSEYEARMAEREASQLASQASNLRDRLLALAGYDPARLPRADDERRD